MFLDVRNNLSETDRKQMKTIIGLVLTKYHTLAGYERRDPERNTMYFQGVVDGLNNAYKIVDGESDDYADFTDYEDYAPPSLLLSNEEVEKLNSMDIDEYKRNNLPCICKGNWRNIINECEPFLGKVLLDSEGIRHRFFGLVHGDDDYYYGLLNLGTGKTILSSCAMPLEYEYTVEA